MGEKKRNNYVHKTQEKNDSFLLINILQFVFIYYSICSFFSVSCGSSDIFKQKISCKNIIK